MQRLVLVDTIIARICLFVSFWCDYFNCISRRVWTMRLNHKMCFISLLFVFVYLKKKRTISTFFHCSEKYASCLQPFLNISIADFCVNVIKARTIRNGKKKYIAEIQIDFEIKWFSTIQFYCLHLCCFHSLSLVYHLFFQEDFYFNQSIKKNCVKTARAPTRNISVLLCYFRLCMFTRVNKLNAFEFSKRLPNSISIPEWTYR